jgi:hypothetical protein
MQEVVNMPGFADQGAVLVNQTADGVRLETLWEEIESVTRLWNAETKTIANLVSYETTVPADAVPQTLQADSFDEASEYGVPQSMAAQDYLKVGYDFRDWDKATRFTWKFLRDASAEQVRAQVTRILEADSRLTTGLVLQRLFDNTSGTNDFQNVVYPLWANDGIAPPAYMGRTFTGSHNHYLVSGAADLDSGDIEDAARLVTEHGWGRGGASGQLLILANPADGELIRSWRAGIESRSGGPKAKYDFIPSASAPAFYTSETVVGALPPTDMAGIPIAGSYGPMWLVESEVVPIDYVAVAASGGLDSPANPFAMRVHPNPAYQGLRAIPGVWQRYPIIESMFARGCGVGTRSRSAAAIVQVKASGSYEPPTISL